MIDLRDLSGFQWDLASLIWIFVVTHTESSFMVRFLCIFFPGFLCFDFLFFGFYASVLIDECLVLDLDWFWLICGCDAMMNVLITGLRQWRGMASSFLAVSRLNHSNDFSFHWALSILLNSTTFFFIFWENLVVYFSVLLSAIVSSVVFL